MALLDTQISAARAGASHAASSFNNSNGNGPNNGNGYSSSGNGGGGGGNDGGGGGNRGVVLDVDLHGQTAESAQAGGPLLFTLAPTSFQR